MNLEIIILAGGQGTRMRSNRPKALHLIGGAPMLHHVITAANALAPQQIHVVVGAHGERVKAALKHAHAGETMPNLNWVAQAAPRGSGHAAQQAMPGVADAAMVLILYSDTPLIGAPTLRSLLAAAHAQSESQSLALLTARVENPTGLGRIVRDARGKVTGIVEQKDADSAQQQIRECNTGVLAGRADIIKAALARVDNRNAAQEFYLTDVIAHAVAAGVEIATCQPRGAAAVAETIGVNCSLDLMRAERIFQARQARDLLAQGVRLRDAARLDVRGRCQFGRDCEVDINVILEGAVEVGAQCKIGANTIVRDSRIGAGSIIEANCVIEQAVIGARCVIGPFARLRPHTQIAAETRIGNFVEIKQSHIGQGSKINHLSYVGDSELGVGVNIGAGVITCNYDGANKHRTRIGDDVLIGANSQLVAPLVIGDGATIGAGSTITKNVAAKKLALSRARQSTVPGWARPVKKTRSAEKSAETTTKKSVKK